MRRDSVKKKKNPTYEQYSDINNTYLFNEIKDILIINKFNVAPINFFFCIFFLLHFENVLLNKGTHNQHRVKNAKNTKVRNFLKNKPD